MGELGMDPRVIYLGTEVEWSSSLPGRCSLGEALPVSNGWETE
jgi:hypothetical protein